MIQREHLSKSTTVLHRDNYNNMGRSNLSFNNPPKSHRTVNRLYDLESKKKEKLAAMQFQKYKDELSTLQTKPEISLTSKLIAKYKVTQPIYARTQDILNQKEQNLKKLKDEVEVKKKALEPDLPFEPQINKKSGFGKSRTVKEFTTQVYAWQSKKNESIQREQYETLTRELETLTFKPLINTKSKYLIMNKTMSENLRVEDRLHKRKEEAEEKKKIMIEKTKPRFKPYITEKSQNLLRNRERLYETKRQPKSKSPMNKSYMDFDAFKRQDYNEDEPEDLYHRSVTPTRTKFDPLTSKRVVIGHKKSYNPPKVNEVEYTPAVDFLLKKIA